MAFILESFLAGAAEQATNFMEAEKEEERRRQRAEDDFDITKKGIDYRLEAQDKLSRREEREKQKEWAVEATRTLKDLGYGDEVIADLLTSKTAYTKAVEVGEQNRKTGLFDSPDEIYKSFGGNSDIITKAGEITNERFRLDGSAYRALYKPEDKSFSNLNARLTHFVGLHSTEKDQVKKDSYLNQVNDVLKAMKAEAKAKRIDSDTDIFSQAGAQSRISFELGLARGKLSDVTLGDYAVFENNMYGREGEQYSADLKAVASLREQWGDSSSNLTTMVNALEKAANYELQRYAKKIKNAANNPNNVEYIDYSNTVKKFYKKETSAKIVNDKLAKGEYKSGDVIVYPEEIEEEERLPDKTTVKIKKTVIRTLIYTGVPLTYASGQIRSYIIGQ